MSKPKKLEALTTMRMGDPYVILEATPVAITEAKLTAASKRLKDLGFDNVVDQFHTTVTVPVATSDGDVRIAFMSSSLVGYLAATESDDTARQALCGVITRTIEKKDTLHVEFVAQCHSCPAKARVRFATLEGRSLICAEKSKAVPWVIPKGHKVGLCPRCVAATIAKVVER